MKPKRSRRSFLKSVTAAAAAAAVPPARAVSARKPNLLFLWTDEQRPDTIDVYGNKRIQAPNLSKLASESIVFRNAYVTQPVCTPSRSSIMTGLWPHQTGCTQNNIALSESIKAFPEIVADPDYRTGYFGKWHLGDEAFAQHGFEEWRSIEDGYWNYFREGRDIGRVSDYSIWLRGLGYTPDTTRGGFTRGFAVRRPIEHCKPKFLELEACDFLRRHKDEPFMLHVNFLEPHMPFYGPLNTLHALEDVELPQNFNDPLEENEPAAYRERVKKYVIGKYADEFDLTRDEEWKRLVAHYWGLVSQVDRSVGAILATLEELGLADHTIVVFTSDHGDMMGSHKMIEKSLMYEEAMRVPWMVRVPQWGRKQRIVEGNVSQIDLVPTLLELMGVKPPTPLSGKSLVPVMRGEAKADEPIYVQWHAPQMMPNDRNPGGARRDATILSGPSSRAVITPDGWKLCLHDTDLDQLFNLVKDPGETTNVFDRPENKETVKKLASLLRNWQENVGDTLRFSEFA